MTEYPGSDDIERRIDAVYEPAERLGAFLPVNRTITVGPHNVEIIATLADSTTTAILYRCTREAMIHPDVLAPSEIAGSAHGTFWRDLHVHHFGPIQPHRDSIAVSFVARGFDGDEEAASSEPVILPVDRSRTAPHERFFAERPELEVPGVRVRTLGGAVGITGATLELFVESTDPDALALDFGGRLSGLMRHVGRGPGPAAFWREWLPEEAEMPARRVGGPGGRIAVSAGVSMRLTARRVEAGTTDVAPARSGEPEPESLDPESWTVRSLPEGSHLPAQGFSGGGGPGDRTTTQSVMLRFGVPPGSSSAVEITLHGITPFYFGSEVTVAVPGPRPDSTVDLSAYAFPWQGGRIDLVSWRSRSEGGWMTHRLAVRPSQTGWQPDIRVLNDDASVSLWLHPMTDGTHRGGLPAMYNPILERAEVPLALRMVGVARGPVRFSLPLTPAGPP